jgi:hypothetical protein
MAIVISWAAGADRNSDDPTVYGPFKSGQEANAWGSRNLGSAVGWYWMPLTIPPYAALR